MFSLIDSLKIAAALVLGAVLAWGIQGVRYNSLRHEYDRFRADASQAQLNAVQAARLVEQRNTKRMQEALEDAERREAKNLADAAAARRTAGSLRDQLAGIKASLPGVSAAACRGRSAVLTDVLGDCAASYAGMAEQADRIASDLRTVIGSWPQ